MLAMVGHSGHSFIGVILGKKIKSCDPVAIKMNNTPFSNYCKHTRKIFFYENGLQTMPDISIYAFYSFPLNIYKESMKTRGKAPNS